MNLQLAGKVALVTGGTRGIGRAVVEGLAAEGARVAFCARDADEVSRVTAELVDADLDVTGAPVDVADGDALTSWVTDVARTHGGIDVLVANVSAVALGAGEEDWRAAFEVDLLHTIRLVEAAFPHLERSTAASVIAISSASARQIDAGSGPYGVMKAAIVHYLSGLADRGAAAGIRANVVSPGMVRFPGGMWEHIAQTNPELYAQSVAANPTGRLGTPEETAYAVLMLASPRASRISGTNLLVDGAYSRGVQL